MAWVSKIQSTNIGNVRVHSLQNNNIGPKGAETLAMGFGGCKNLVMLRYV